MHLRNEVEFVEQQAERAEQTISWLEEHSDEIGSPAAVRAASRVP